MCFSIYQSEMALLLPFIALLSTAYAFQATVCDCSNPSQVGLLQFSDGVCEPSTKPVYNKVDYRIFTETRAAAVFPAYICGRWKLTKVITTNLFGQPTVVHDKIALDTSTDECKTMQETKRCEDQAMTFTDGKWSYTVEPAEDSRWLQIINVFTINCMLEEIKLTQIHESEPVITPLGIANVTVGKISHNHLTLIWDSTYTTRLDADYRQLEKGTGIVYNSSTPDVYRLDDATKQLGFHLKSMPRCRSRYHCESILPSYGVIGEDHLFVVIYPDAYGKTNFDPKQETVFIKPSNETENTTTEYLHAVLNAHVQYLEDTIVGQENEIIRVVNSIQCEARRAKHSRAISTAQYNGWLAASQLQLPKCTKLTAFGQTVVATKCQPVVANFTTEVTSCGPQPRFRNSTINLDGWELVAFSPCYWTTGFVNFNDKPYAFRNNTWEPIEAKIVLPQQDLANTFRYDDLKPLAYEHQTNPAYTEAMLSPMNVLADFASTMNEHAAGIFGVNQSTSTITVLYSAADKVEEQHVATWWENLVHYTMITIFIIVALVISRFLYAIGACGMLWNICCKMPKPPHSAPQSQPPVKIRPSSSSRIHPDKPHQPCLKF